MITVEEKHFWAAKEAERLRECGDLIAAGEMVAEPGFERDSEIVDAIAEDYRQSRHDDFRIKLGASKIPAFLRGPGDADAASPAATSAEASDLPSLGGLLGIKELAIPASLEHRAPSGGRRANPVNLILIGAAALALSLVSAWHVDRVIADWYYEGNLQE